MKVPYNLTPKHLFELLEIISEAGNSLSQAKAESRFGSNKRKFSRTKNAAVTLGLVKEKQHKLELTETGATVADTENRSKGLRKVIEDFGPYKKLLEKGKNDQDNILEITTAVSFLQENAHMAEKTAKAAARFAFNLLEEAQLGTYKKGRGGMPSRLFIDESGIEDPKEDLSIEEEQTKSLRTQSSSEGGYFVIFNGPSGERKIDIQDQYDVKRAKTELDILEARLSHEP